MADTHFILFAPFFFFTLYSPYFGPNISMLPWKVCQDVAGCQYLELNWTVGIVIGAVLYGALVTLGINCIRLLVPQGGRDSPQLRLLRGYVYALLLVNTIFGIGNFIWANCFTIFGRSTPVFQLGQMFISIELFCTLTIVVVGTLTDGLLVSGSSALL